MKCKRVLSGAVLTAICVSMTGALSGCGEKEVTVYKSDHNCGDWHISSLDELLFEKRTSAGKIAEIIPDFCMYEGFEDIDNDEVIEEDFSADVYVIVDGFKIEGRDDDTALNVRLHFNADKEFIGWTDNNSYCNGLMGSYIESNFNMWYNFFEDSLGSPSLENSCIWWFDEGEIEMNIYQKDDEEILDTINSEKNDIIKEVKDGIIPSSARIEMHMSVEYTPN